MLNIFNLFNNILNIEKIKFILAYLRPLSLKKTSTGFVPASQQLCRSTSLMTMTISQSFTSVETQGTTV